MSIPVGRYLIKNVSFGTYVTNARADEGTPLSETANASTAHEKWNIVALGNGNYSISNLGTTLNARVDPPESVGFIVKGSSQPEQWTFLESRVQGQFRIASVESNLYWTFLEPDEGTPVTLQSEANDAKSLWTFVSIQ